MRRKPAGGRMFDDELLFFEEKHDHAEEYMEALVMLEQEGMRVASVSEVAGRLRIKPPSVVQMLSRLAKRGLVAYRKGKGARLTAKGRRIGNRMVRNGRLMEVFISDVLKMPLDIRVAHTLEHGMTDPFADALCTLLRHPKFCPHGYPIPPGRCCPGRVASPRRRQGPKD